MEPRLCLSAASITAFTATATNNGHEVRLSGYVSDESPASVQLTFSGVAAGGTTAGANGYFELVTQASGLGTVQAIAVDNEQLESLPGSAMVTSAVPVISGLTATETGNGRMVTVTGTVMDEAPGGRSVTLGGVVSGVTTTNSNGQFSVTLEASALGTVTAVTNDVWGQASAVAQTMLTSVAPSISNFMVVESGPNRTVTVTGTVNDISAGGRTVTLSGVVNGSVVTNSNGTFSATLQASQLGKVYAQTTDVWGQTSATAQATLTSGTPGLSLMASESMPNWFTISGTVSDAYPAGLTVVFGGLLAGATTTTTSAGTFYYGFTVPAPTVGYVTATVTDMWGQISFQAQVLIYNYS